MNRCDREAHASAARGVARGRVDFVCSSVDGIADGGATRRPVGIVVAVIAIAATHFGVTGQAAPIVDNERENALPLPSATIGQPYKAMLPLRSAEGKVESKLIEGQLPEGMSAKDGWICGVPQQSGRFHFSIIATDEIGQTAAGRFVMDVMLPPAPPLTIAHRTLPPCIACQPYFVILVAEGGYPPYTWELKRGRLFDGLRLERGTITGAVEQILEAPLETEVVFLVRDALGNTASKDVRLIAVPNPSVILTLGLPSEANTEVAQLPPAVFGQPYSVAVPFRGGYGVVKCSTTDPLPEGLRLVENTLSGIPKAVGQFIFEVLAEDQIKQRVLRRFSMQVLPPSPEQLRIESVAIPPAELGERYMGILRARGGLPPYRWRIIQGNLPSWATLEGDTISGIPHHVSALGATKVAVMVSDSTKAEAGPEMVVIQVVPSLSYENLEICSKDLPTAIVGMPYFAVISLRGGKPPYRIRYLGKAPGGLSVNESGEVRGMPESAGTYALSISVEDSLGQMLPSASIKLEVITLADPRRIDPQRDDKQVTEDEVDVPKRNPADAAGRATQPSSSRFGGVAGVGWSLLGFAGGAIAGGGLMHWIDRRKRDGPPLRRTST